MLTCDCSHLDYFKLAQERRRLDCTRLSSRLKVAVLADCDTQHLVPLLEVLFARSGVAAEIYAAEFDTIEQEVLDENSGLYAFGPEIVLLLQTTNVLRLKYYERESGRAVLADELADATAALWDAIARRSRAVVIQSNFVLPYERQFGNFDQKVPESLHGVVSRLNTQLAARAGERSGVLINDLEAIASYVGRNTWCDERLWTMAKVPCSLEHLPRLAQNSVDIALCVKGRGVKCVVLDLDNTLWGGVIGDDGLDGIRIGHFGEGEPFHRFQQFLRELKRRGVVLAVCSKNDLDNAVRPFREHPEMVLREEDISVFVANWETKVDNIKDIRETLNIGLDSMVFLDDNPFERNMVRQYLPELIVPELPEEPSDYVRAICELNLFEASAYTEEDRQRARLYREDSTRRILEKRFTNVGEYLQSLEMKVEVARFDAFHLPRIAQLIQRSNQFNLTTRRYAEVECERLMNDPDCLPLRVRLSDRFGDYGLISVVVLKFAGTRGLIDLWLMSCRVLARGVEEHVMNRVVSLARERGATTLVGTYLPTAKNNIVKEFYGRFGFEKTREESDGGSTWILETAVYEPRTTWLTEAQTGV